MCTSYRSTKYFVFCSLLVGPHCILFYFFHPIYYLRPPFSLSLLVVAQIRGHIAGSSTPLPTTVRASHFFIANDTKCDIRVDSASGVRGGDNFRRSTKLEPARTPSIYQVRDSDNMSSPTKKRLTREAGAADESE